MQDGQEDTGTGGTPPPGTGGTPTTSETTTPTPNTTTTTWVTPVPIGDCECGQGIKWERIASSKGLQLNRPWMVHFRWEGEEWWNLGQFRIKLHFRIQLENKEHIACSGSLINRRSDGFSFFPTLSLFTVLISGGSSRPRTASVPSMSTSSAPWSTEDSKRNS